MAEWVEGPLGELVELKRGYDLPQQSRQPGTIPIVSSSGVSDFHAQSKVSGPGVVTGRYGTIGQVFYIEGDFWPLNTTLYVRDFKGNDPRFVSYFLRGINFLAYSDKAAVPGLNRNHLHTAIVRYPKSKAQQHSIASILSALDDKIELNWRINETLEAMARAIFKDWFERECAELPRIRAHELVEAGVLAIGDGYRAKNDELFEPGLPFVRAANLNNGFDLDGCDVLNVESAARAGDKSSRVGDVAFTSKGTIGRFARVGEHSRQFVYSPQVCFWRSVDPQEFHPSILYCWMQSGDFQTQVHSVSGQTDMAPYVSLTDQRRMFVPDFRLADRQPSEEIEPLLMRQSLNIAENQTLASIRDLLLPKLMSGEIRVKDAKRVVGERV